nr:hypothetical protein [Tanacetum cinerariifolium]
MDYKRTKEYLPMVHHSRQMDEELRKSYRTLEKCLLREGRILTPSFITENNMIPFCQAVGLESFLTLNEPYVLGDNEAPSFLEFYNELSDNEDLTQAQRVKRGMFKCLNCYVSTITKYLEKKVIMLVLCLCVLVVCGTLHLRL